jgi:nucleotidyltransferase-like protein
MAIPESQLATWAHQGAVQTAAATHASIRRALGAASSPIQGMDYEAFLQGSYKNDTNVRGDSDVDLVAQLNSTVQPELSALTDHERELYRQTHSDATYVWGHFRRDVLAALSAYYGGQVSEGNKSLKVAGESGRLPCDVVVAPLHGLSSLNGILGGLV